MRYRYALLVRREVANDHGVSARDTQPPRLFVELDGVQIELAGDFGALQPGQRPVEVQHVGPTADDFEQLQRAPYRLVLSSCDSGVLAPAGADELLGLVSSLLPLGTAGIVAAVVPLNDQAVVPLMVDLHRHLRAGQTLADAIYSVRRGLSSDPVQQATAASLITLGAG